MEKVFITKYALTKGILEKEAEIRDYGYEYEIAYVKGEFSSYSLGKEAFRTREQLLARIYSIDNISCDPTIRVRILNALDNKFKEVFGR